MKKYGKRYRAALEKAEVGKRYDLKGAFATLLSLPATKFDETVELALHLAVDPKQSDQMVRGRVQLPNGNGKDVRVIAFTKDPQAALKAGACEAGLSDLMEKIKGGWLDFDVAVSTTEAMKDVKTLARLLGPKGLMPSPKAGTVTDDLAACGIQDGQSGKRAVGYRKAFIRSRKTVGECDGGVGSDPPGAPVGVSREVCA